MSDTFCSGAPLRRVARHGQRVREAGSSPTVPPERPLYASPVISASARSTAMRTARLQATRTEHVVSRTRVPRRRSCCRTAVGDPRADRFLREAFRSAGAFTKFMRALWNCCRSDPVAVHLSTSGGLSLPSLALSRPTCAVLGFLLSASGYCLKLKFTFFVEFRSSTHAVLRFVLFLNKIRLLQIYLLIWSFWVFLLLLFFQFT